MRFRSPLHRQGFTLVEVVIVSAISVLVFGAIFASFHYSLSLINLSRAKLSAISLANERMEYFRSLPYTNVGTVSGIPSGTIPQTSVVSLNGIEFTEQVLVEYVDDPGDGQDTATTSDSNGISSDYKRVKLEYSWDFGGVPGQIMMISNIVPRSIETTAGGGTVRVNVLDSDSTLLPGATVRLINNTTTSTIDVTRTTDVSGAALFSGAPAASNYEVIVTATIGGHQYSTAKTYQATTSLPSPILAPFSVLEADVSTLTVQIGELSDLAVRTLSGLVEMTAEEDFSDLAGVQTATNVDSVGGKLVLDDTAGVYPATGSAYLQNVTPTTLHAWQKVRVASSLPLNTGYRVRFYTSTTTGSYNIIPDSDLPGNAAGFIDSLIDISSLDTTTYPSLVVGLELTTADSSRTPSVTAVGVTYRESETVLANQNFDLRGDKVIGTDGASNPVYKYDEAHTTDSSGELTVPNLEFDTYRASVTGYDVAEACPGNPFTQRAGVDGQLELVLVPNTANTLRVTVADSSGNSLPGAQVEVSRPGFSDTLETGGCGQVFFSGLSSALDYDVNVTLAGYVTATMSDVSVSGDTVVTVTPVLE